MAVRNGPGYNFSTSNNQSSLSVDKDFFDYFEGTLFFCAPYKVHDVVLKTGDGGDYVVYQICPGMLNNQMPQVYDVVNEEWQYLDTLAEDAELVLDFASTTSSIVYLRAGPDATTNAFPPTTPDPSDPDDPYPRIYSTGAAVPADTDVFGYVAIAKVNEISAGVYTVDQYVTGSLWADRLKTGTDTARYYYARI